MKTKRQEKRRKGEKKERKDKKKEKGRDPLAALLVLSGNGNRALCLHEDAVVLDVSHHCGHGIHWLWLGRSG